MVNECKAAQVAAYFLERAPGRTMSHLKLMRLLYLADREAVRSFGWLISGDRFASTPAGPVLVMTLNLMDGDVESQPGGWEDWISDKGNHEFSLRQPLRADTLDELAPAELDTLKAVWDKFGGMGTWEIRDWTRQNCAEWRDPNGSSLPIPYAALARAVGFDEAAAGELAARIRAEQEIDSHFAALGAGSLR